jgi:hypothetical protein
MGGYECLIENEYVGIFVSPDWDGDLLTLKNKLIEMGYIQILPVE